MTNQDEFKTFYEIHLKPKLVVLENQRKSIVIKLFFVLICYGVLMRLAVSLMTLDQNWMLEVIIMVTLIGVWIIFFFDKKSSFYVVLTLVMIILVAMYQGGQIWVLTSIVVMIFLSLGVKIFYHKVISSYQQKFKQEIVGSIVTFIDKNLTYNPTEKIPREEFQASGLFEQNYGRTVDKWDGEDYIEGVLDTTLIKFSEVQAQEYETDSEGDSHYETLFKGLFFIFNFNLNFGGITVILPNYVKPGFFNRLFGKDLPSWQTKITYLQLVKLTDPEFEREFTVYSNNPTLAHYALSEGFKHRLLVFRHRLNKAVYLSFANSKLYMAIDVGKDLFEPTIFRTLLKFKLLQEFFEYLQLGKEVVDYLNSFLATPNSLLSDKNSFWEIGEDTLTTVQIPKYHSFYEDTEEEIQTTLQIPQDNFSYETGKESLTRLQLPGEDFSFETQEDTLTNLQLPKETSPFKIEGETLIKFQIPK